MKHTSPKPKPKSPSLKSIIEKRLMSKEERLEFQKKQRLQVERRKKLLENSDSPRRTYGERIMWRGQIVEK